jgi:CelD/BcsL family acetyltransferase involved in cellulose biosynthesis
MPEKLEVRVLRDGSQIDQIRPTWERWQRHPNSDIDFFFTILRERSEILRPHITVLYRDQLPQAMLVGRIELKDFVHKVGYLRLFRHKIRMLTLPFGGLLGDASDENCAAIVTAVMESLRQGEADVAIFEPVNVKSALYRCALTAPPQRCRDHLRTSHTHRSMALFESIEAFQQSLSTKVRKNLKWQAKKILGGHPGKVRLAHYDSPRDLELILKDTEEIAKKTYQRGLGVGFADNSENRARMKLEAEKGWLRAYVLYLDSKPSAFWLGTVYKGTFHSDFMGYDPACAKYSPGMYLVTNVIEDLCKPNGTGKIDELDFGLGDAQYKQVLGTNSWEESEIYIFAPSFRGFILNSLRTSLSSLDRVAKKTLDRTKLLPRVKNMWRKSARDAN